MRDMEHSYSAAWWVQSAAEAEAWAKESCDAYFGEQRYEMAVSAVEQRPLHGNVQGYKVSLEAWAIHPD